MGSASIPRGPAGGVGKGKHNDRTNGVKRAPQALERLQNFVQNGSNGNGIDSNNNNSGISTSRFVLQPPKGRCPDHPYCKNKECTKAHPTRNCFAYPNCSNPPGTCNYLHPEEDKELIEKLAISKKEYEQRQLNYLLVKQGSCKFGSSCAKENCPYAHPTPANPNAKIKTLDWCSAGKDCVDESCEKSHPRVPNASTKVLLPPEVIALEQCKFGMSCTNARCPRRHATSSVPCRLGANCTNVSCTFAHPINEPCRFGAQCNAPFCLFQHPPERQTPSSNTWSNTATNGNSVTNRQFAVADDQVMEQVVQQ